MELWGFWWICVIELRPAFARWRTFLWFSLALAATGIRQDHRFVTCMPRALGLSQQWYERFLAFFHSSAVRLDILVCLWTALALRVLAEHLLTINGRIVLLADGLKVAKSGRKMPAVKKLHQESQNNSKPEYIFGHSCQALALVVNAASSLFALPLVCRIHEGLIFSNRDRRTLLDKLVELFFGLGLNQPCYLVADAYYAAGKIIRPLIRKGHHLITVAKRNAVAYLPPPPATPGPGRKRIYGDKVRLRNYFDDLTRFTTALSPVYGEQHVTLLYRVEDLYWRAAGTLVRFVFVIHPTRGRMILLCTDLTLPALPIIRLYGIRFKIEVSFKQAIHTLGTYAYHFWMAPMKPRPQRSGNQYLHCESEDYRRLVRRKMTTYHCHIQVGIIAQGLLQVLAILKPQAVWRWHASWLRTIRPGIPPSEWVTAAAMRNSLPQFLADSDPDLIFAQFLRNNIDPDMAEGLRLAS